MNKLIDEYGIPEASISIAFSGCKGFHLTVNPNVFNAQPFDSLPSIWKSIAGDFARKYKLKTLDLSIYDRRRLWRLLNSRHDKTGLYAVQITKAELENLDIEQIKQLASKPREPFITAEFKPAPEAERLFNEHKEKVEAWMLTRKQRFETSQLKTVTDDPPCIKKLLEKGAQKGNRNITTFQLAIYYAGKDMSQQEIQQACAQFAAKSDEPLSENEIETLVDSAVTGFADGRYSIGCSIFADLCDKPNCPFFAVDEKPDWSKIGEPISFDEWRTTIQNNFPDLWTCVEACASTVAALLIQNVSPLCLVLQGVPSGGKTTTLNFFKSFPLSHSTDNSAPEPSFRTSPRKQRKNWRRSTCCLESRARF